MIIENGTTMLGLGVERGVSLVSSVTVGENIWVVDSSHSQAAYGTSNLRYIPLPTTGSWVDLEFCAGRTGTMQIALAYALAPASASTLGLDLTYRIYSDGDDLTTALGAALSASLAPGAVTTRQTAAPANWIISTTAGDHVRARIERTDAIATEIRIPHLRGVAT